MTEATTEPTTDQDWYLEPERNFTRYWWLAAGFLALLLLGGAALTLALGPNHVAGLIFADSDRATVTATPTLEPTIPPTPRPATLPNSVEAPVEGATPVPEAILSAQPWTEGAPVGLFELALFLPDSRRTVSHRPPPGFRYWRGDLLQTRQAYAWTGAGPAEVHWFLFYEPEAAFPATVTVTVDGQALDLVLFPDTPATTTAVLE